MIKKILLVFFSFPFLVVAQTSFAGLGAANSGGTGYKTITANSNILVSNGMSQDGTEMYTTATYSIFHIIADGVNTKYFTFEDMNFRGFISQTVSSASTVVFKDKDGNTIQTMTLNANKSLGTSSTSMVGFFDNGTTTPINNVAEIIIDIKNTFSTPESQNINYVNITLSNYTLPVELSSFNALINGNIVMLKWQTATEVNNNGFEVQRQILRSAQNDNTGWEKVGFIAGYGNSNSPKSYSFMDQPTGGTSFSYRLKQIDNDGQFKYYDPITVTLASSDKVELMDNYPNPFNPSTAIKFYIPNNSDVTIKIYDMLGREVNTIINKQSEAGYYIVYWNGLDRFGNSAASGVYLYRLFATGEAGSYSETKKMQLMK